MSIAGRARSALLGLVLAFAAGSAVLVLLFLLRGGPSPGSTTEARAAAAPAARSAPAPEPMVDPVDPAAGRDPVAQGQGDSSLYAGRGTIRGEVLLRDAAVFPERWTLVLRPHPWLQGSRHAEARTVDFVHGETTFGAEDLPLGGYLVEARARGFNCVPGNVLLVRGSSDQFVTLLLSPGGSIDGGVLDGSGRPAEGLDVTLESIETGERRTLSTDAAGTFLFRDVLDGEYRLLYGRPDSPLLPAESIGFKAPSMRLPTRTLPPSSSLAISVVDVELRPVAGVRISGSAPGASAVDTMTDERGIARAPYLLPGHYRIDARAEGGPEVSATIDISAGKDASLDLVLR